MWRELYTGINNLTNFRVYLYNNHLEVRLTQSGYTAGQGAGHSTTDLTKIC